MRILIMAGGTGGHIYPALAVVKRLQQQGHMVHWLGVRGSMEESVAADNGIPMHFVAIAGLRGKGWATLLSAPWRLSRALVQSTLVMLSFKPDVVLGMGGYVTGPAGLAAWLTRRRLVIHEQNAVAGATNQILARLAQRVLEAFPQSFPPKISALLTGNPVREDFAKLLSPDKRQGKNQAGALKILVLGGSGGARALNNLMPQLLGAWPEMPAIMVWHQAGKKNIHDAQQAYQNCDLKVAINALVDNSVKLQIKLVDYIQDMANAYAWADIIICRAGALTVAEIAAAGVASVLIPYPYAVDDHQTKNAEYLAQAGAAIIMQERDLNVIKLREILADLSVNRTQLAAMAQAAYGLAKPDALDLVVAQLI